jgi:hypothetical protein
MTYLLFLCFPDPVLTFLENLHFSISSPTPNPVRIESKSLVLVLLSLSKTNGISGTWLTLCPLAKTNEGMAEAAKAEATACLLWTRLTFLCHLLHVVLALNILPPLHMLPKAPCPDLWVPDPPTLGIRATALPVPQDSALYSIPALW